MRIGWYYNKRYNEFTHIKNDRERFSIPGDWEYRGKDLSEYEIFLISNNGLFCEPDNSLTTYELSVIKHNLTGGV